MESHVRNCAETETFKACNGSWTQHTIAKTPVHRISNWTSSESSTEIYWVTWSLPHASFLNLAYIKFFHPPENKTHAILQNIYMFPPSTISYQGVSWNILELTNRVRISSLQSMNTVDSDFSNQIYSISWLALCLGISRLTLEWQYEIYCLGLPTSTEWNELTMKCICSIQPHSMQK